MLRIGEALQTPGLSRLEAQALLGALLQRERAWLIAHGDELLSDAQAAQWQEGLRRLADGEPLAYLLGRQEFHGLMLDVSRATLVPRPDTETLVDWALELLAPDSDAVDLGTGSGAIALALKHRRPAARISASDRSVAALAQARTNGERLGLAVEWLQGNWWQPLAGRRFGLALSNPPYIAADDPHLPALRHEPLEALSPGGDGLDAIRQLIAGAPQHLYPGAWLLLEHGHDQADAVAALFAANGQFRPAEHRLDLAGHRRCTGAPLRC